MKFLLAIACGVAVLFLLRVLAAFLLEYLYITTAYTVATEDRSSIDKQSVTIKNAVRSKGSIDAGEKIAKELTLGTVLTLPVYANWETSQAASSLGRNRKMRSKQN